MDRLDWGLHAASGSVFWHRKLEEWEDKQLINDDKTSLRWHDVDSRSKPTAVKMINEDLLVLILQSCSQNTSWIRRNQNKALINFQPNKIIVLDLWSDLKEGWQLGILQWALKKGSLKLQRLFPLFCLCVMGNHIVKPNKAALCKFHTGPHTFVLKHLLLALRFGAFTFLRVLYQTQATTTSLSLSSDKTRSKKQFNN